MVDNALYLRGRGTLKTQIFLTYCTIIQRPWTQLVHPTPKVAELTKQSKIFHTYIMYSPTVQPSSTTFFILIYTNHTSSRAYQWGDVRGGFAGI